MAQRQQAPLALPAAAHGSEAGWKKGSNIIDALPYIDTLSAEEKKQVEALIDEECKRSVKRPSDYLAELGAMPSTKFEGHPLLAAELERVKAKQPMPPLDISRYRLDPPPQARRNDVAAWRSCVDNAHAQLEHQYNRIHNLELLLKYGDKSWRAQVSTDEAVLKQLETDLANTRKQVTALNQERKLSHTAAGSELRKVHEEYMTLVAKNMEIEAACDALEEQIDALRTQLEPPAPRASSNGAAAHGPTSAGSSGTGQGEAQQQQPAAAGPTEGPSADDVQGAGSGAPRAAAGQPGGNQPVEGQAAMDVDDAGGQAQENGH